MELTTSWLAGPDAGRIAHPPEASNTAPAISTANIRKLFKTLPTTTIILNVSAFSFSWHYS
jgi:hypothetical protein